MSTTLKVCLLSSALCLTGASVSFADDASAPAPAAPTPPPQAEVWAQIDGGITVNTDSPADHKNFGNPFNDNANRPMLNQILLTTDKALGTDDYAIGWKLQGMYGSDARLTHYLGLANYTIKERNQLDLIEANVSVHTPWLGAGGMDIKAGFYPTPLGNEVIDPSGNTFYSHSMLFTFGLPLKHTGVLTTTHANAMVDVYVGVDTGTNTTFGKTGDNNGALAYIFGFGLNGLAGGKLTVLALTHLGPEQARHATAPGVDPNKATRFFNDVLLTYKATDKLTLITELNYVKEDAVTATTSAEGYGFDQYVQYALADNLTISARGEIWRDAQGFFVAEPLANFDVVNAERGLPNTLVGPFVPTTYGDITVGVQYKPTVAGFPVAFTVRPELRYDAKLAGTVKPYNVFTSNGQFTAAVDIIAKF